MLAQGFSERCRRKIHQQIKATLRALATSLLPNETHGDRIVALPCVIRRPGRCYLPTDLVSEGAAGTGIEVRANNVTIDLQGHALRCAAGSANCATGIGGSNLANVAIINGTVAGFRYGICLHAGKRYRVESVRADGNWQWGLSVDGSDCVVRDNAVVNTGGSTAPCSKACIAVRAFGARQTVESNVISGVRRSPSNAEWVGIHFDSAPDSHLENNVISAATREPLTWGVWLNGGNWKEAGGTNVFVSRNLFINLQTAGTFADHAAGTCSDNLLINLADSFVASGPDVALRNRGGNVHYLRVKVKENQAGGDVTQFVVAEPRP